MKIKENCFVKSFNKLSKKVYENAVEHGFWDTERNEGEMIALMHSELSEALEGVRSGNKMSDKISGFNQVEEEFADVIIRIMDMSYKKSYCVAEAIIAKMEYNKKRPFKHNKKF